MVAVAGASAGAATARQDAAAQPQVRVPWAAVGPGWELAQYTNGSAGKPAATTL